MAFPNPTGTRFWPQLLAEYEQVCQELDARPLTVSRTCTDCTRGYREDELFDGLCQECIEAGCQCDWIDALQDALDAFARDQAAQEVAS